LRDALHLQGRAAQGASLKILVVAPSWIGDCVAAQPLLRRLHERHPGAAIDLLAPPWVAPLAARMPEVRGVLDNPLRHGEFGLLERLRLARRMRVAAYDMAIVLPNSWKSALVPWLAGIPVRVGYTGEARHGLINRRHRLERGGRSTIAERYARLADAPGEAALPDLPQPRLAAEPAQCAATAARLGLDGDAAPVALCPGAEYGPAKRWPEEYWARIAGCLAARGHAVWLIGSANDTGIAQAIAAAVPRGCRNLCGRTTLAQAIDLLAIARFVLTNDSGLMHVAAALDRPMIALFGSSSPRYTPPLSKNAEVLWLELACSPCFKRECPLGHFRCMREIQPERVEARLAARLPPP